MQGAAFLGVFSSSPSQDGLGIRRQLYFVWSRENGKFDAQRLDGNYRAMGKIFTLTIDELRAQYMYEPKVMVVPSGYTPATAPGGVSVPATSDPAEVESTLREHFRKALLRLKRKNARTAAREALETLLEVEEGIVPRHRFMFADFGKNLRKQKELSLALGFCQRVLRLSPDDDHAHFNIARVLLEQGKFEEAEEHARTACALEPEATIHKKLLDYIVLERKRHQRPGR